MFNHGLTVALSRQCHGLAVAEQLRITDFDRQAALDVGLPIKAERLKAP
jgi:hypothetical protein